MLSVLNVPIQKISRKLCIPVLKRYISDSDLSRRAYWMKRYKSESGVFDWLTDPLLTMQAVLPHINEFITPDCVNCLDIGSGNSEFPSTLLQHCPIPANLICYDYVTESLEFQRRTINDALARNQTKSDSKAFFVCGDVIKLPFQENKIHLVFDKGTTDSLLKDKLDGKQQTLSALSEVYRVLVPSGKLLQFTDEDPDVRLPLLEKSARNDHISVSFKILGGGNFEYFMYCIKRVK